jgi:PKD repeat protein
MFPEARLRNHLLVLVLVCLPCSAQVITLQPTTTIAAEAGNSSSVPDTFAGLSNGNSGAGNVSKVPTRSLLYPGNDTKIFAALMGWWGKSSHINVGYRSDDPVVVNRQVEDMISRGIDGAIIAWYGAGGLEDLTTKQLRTQAELHPGFQFAVMIDKGAIAWHSCAGCGPTDALIAHLNYLADNYYGSPAYFRINGQPVVVEFALESYTIDWNRVYSSIRGNPFIVFRNVTGMSRPGKGAYAWGPSQSLSYNEWFYQQAPKYPEKQVMGGASKGFNDSLASWSQNRYVGQECGMTWLNTMAQVNKYYSSANQLPMLQLITWNDYEEGTAIEPGIDNCLTVSASVTGSVLSWQLNGAGSEATVDHYKVLLSTDDYNLATVATLPAGTLSFDLRSLKLAPDSYTAYVKAVGKPSIRNQMSSAAAYEVPNLPPVGSLSLSTASGYTPLQVAASTAASTDSDGKVTSSVINFGNGQSAAAFSATATYTTAGTYTVQATVKDNLGATSTVRQSVTVKPAGVNFLSPLQGATLGSPVRVRAVANSGNPITGMWLYVDGISAKRVETATMDAYVKLRKGYHDLSIKAWDAEGNIFRAAVRIRVR